MVALGGMHGCSRGACVVALGGHAWLLLGGMHGCSGGACMVAPIGMHGCSGGAGMVALGGHAWLLRGACMVAPGGGMCGCSGGRGFFNEIRSMSGRYASYWNTFLLIVLFFIWSLHRRIFKVHSHGPDSDIDAYSDYLNAQCEQGFITDRNGR